jgi:hypothetical protein
MLCVCIPDSQPSPSISNHSDSTDFFVNGGTHWVNSAVCVCVLGHLSGGATPSRGVCVRGRATGQCPARTGNDLISVRLSDGGFGERREQCRSAPHLSQDTHVPHRT